MSWTNPIEGEPTHEEFFLVWSSPTIRTVKQVSVRLARMGHIRMTARTCWHWYKRLVASGENLRRLAPPPKKTAYEELEEYWELAELFSFRCGDYEGYVAIRSTSDEDIRLLRWRWN